MSISVILLEFWEDDGEIRLEDERAWFIFRKGDESEDGDRVSFPRWGKRNVVSHHFTELVLEITEIEMHTHKTRREKLFIIAV